MLTTSIVIAGALIWISALVQHGNNLVAHGLKWVMSDRSLPITDDGLTGRSARALRNNVESTAMYVPIAIVALISHQASPAIAMTATIYAVVRVTFSLGYWLKINMLRSLSWFVGMICIAVMAILTLGHGVLF